MSTDQKEEWGIFNDPEIHRLYRHFQDMKRRAEQAEQQLKEALEKYEQTHG